MPEQLIGGLDAVEVVVCHLLSAAVCEGADVLRERRLPGVRFDGQDGCHDQAGPGQQEACHVQDAVDCPASMLIAPVYDSFSNSGDRISGDLCQTIDQNGMQPSHTKDTIIHRLSNAPQAIGSLRIEHNARHCLVHALRFCFEDRARQSCETDPQHPLFWGACLTLHSTYSSFAPAGMACTRST